MSKLIFAIIIALVAFSARCENGVDQVIAINGITTHYVTAGPENGPAVIMVHGNGGSYKSMEVPMKVMADAGYRVYALDSRGQGQNAPLDEYHYFDMAEDVNAFIEKLHLQQPVVLGFSDGGIIAIELAMMHPGNVKAIGACGANVQPDGIVPKAYADFKKWVDDARKAGEKIPALTLMLIEEPTLTPEELQTISVPTLIMAGENDLITFEHTVHIHKCIKGSSMLILGGEDHGSYVNSGKAAECFITFLKGL